MSHSRGGLVGELLCRGQFSNGREPFTQEDMGLFQPQINSGLKEIFALGADQDDYKQHLLNLAKLNTALQQAELKTDITPCNCSVSGR